MASETRTPSHPQLFGSRARRFVHEPSMSDETALEYAAQYENVTNASGLTTSSTNLRIAS